MKKILVMLLMLALLCAAGAQAEVGAALKVVNCNEFVTLREEPSTDAAALARVPLGARVDELHWAENGFTCVSYRGRTGYVLSDYLRLDDDYSGTEIDLTREQRYNFNLFLSNFTEAGFPQRTGCFDASWVDEAVLTDFAVSHCWFNRKKQLEWGEYFGGNNVRLPEDQIAPVVKKYFGLKIKPSHDLAYIDYKKGYYYWEETGGHISDGFACLSNVEALGGGRYCVRFDVYGMGEDWDNDVCYYDSSAADAAYPTYDYAPTGRAVIDVGSSGLNDRSGWRLVRYAITGD